jgi:UDPglucose 6-dehydrogenase
MNEPWEVSDTGSANGSDGHSHDDLSLLAASDPMRATVVGTGHVGLTTCVTLAAIGHHVVGIDADEAKVDRLRRGEAPFFEPELQELLTEGMAAGRLSFTTDAGQAIPQAELVFICVGTPGRIDGQPNLVAVEQSAAVVARHAGPRTVIIEKSTVPAGTAQRVKRTILRERPRLDLDVASNPEFLREGTAVRDSLDPDRILIGAESPWAFKQLRRLYDPLIRRGATLIETDVDTAELSKLACNAFLALKISYTNALARICEGAGADVVSVTRVMGADHRIGASFLNAGLGYGGYCFPKDLQALDWFAAKIGYDFPLLREVARINEEAVEETVRKVEDALWNLEGKRIALLGLAFKPNTDDVRFAPALALARMLIGAGAQLVAYDPAAMEAAIAEVPELTTAVDPYEAAAGAHCLVVATEWSEFAELDLERIRETMAYPVVVDARNLYEPRRMDALGFSYYPTGRKPIPERPASEKDGVVDLVAHEEARR